MRVFQIVPCISYGDAISNDMLAIDDVLHKHGIETQIYSRDIDERLADRACSIREMPVPDCMDILIYHMAVASELTEMVKKARCIKVLRYHNITPPEFYEGYNEAAVYACKEGIRQVAELINVMDWCLTDSDYNAKDLQRHGYHCPMITLPVVIPMEDYKTDPDMDFYNTYHDGKTNILFLGRMVPNKKIEDVIRAYAYYRKYWNPESRLILAGSFDRQDLYNLLLKHYIDEYDLSDIVFTGHISFRSILSCYKAADLFLCQSEHEGFCVPLIESMIFQVPIVAYSAAAIPETLGRGGVLLEGKDPIETAAVMNYVLTREELKKEILKNQSEQIKRFSFERVEEGLLKAISEIQAGHVEEKQK